MPFRDDREAREQHSRALERELATTREELEQARRRERALARRSLRRSVLQEQHYPSCSERAFDRMAASLREQRDVGGGYFRETPSKLEFRRGELEVCIERDQSDGVYGDGVLLTLRDTDPSLSRLLSLYGLSTGVLMALLAGAGVGEVGYVVALPLAMTSIVFALPLALMATEHAGGHPYRRSLWEELNAIVKVDRRVHAESAATGVRVGPAQDDEPQDEAPSATRRARDA